MKKIEIVKTVGGLIVSIGVGAIVGNAIKTTTPKDVGLLMKIFIWIGALFLGSLASDKASDYTEQQIDNVATIINDVVTTEEV